jgi:hypothetical protein
MASDRSTGHRNRNLWPDRLESPGDPEVSGHKFASRGVEKYLLTRCYARLPPTFTVRKGSSVRVRQRASPDLQGKRNSLRGAIRDLAQRGRNSRPRSVHFVTPRARVAEANRPAVWSIPRVPPAGDPFYVSARSAPSSVAPPGGPGKRWSPAAVAPLAGGPDRSLGVTATRRGQRAEGQPRGPP